MIEPIGGVLSRRLGRGAPQAFIVISAFVRTNWLAGLLNNLTWSLDRHGIDLVVKLPAPDYGGQSLIRQLTRLHKAPALLHRRAGRGHLARHRPKRAGRLLRVGSTAHRLR